MSRFFLKHHWFHKILPELFYEGEFEQRITLQAPDLYPDYFVIPFKKTVTSPHGNSKPDLIFIAKDYNDWYVVEVEMAYHNYNSHVEPQIRNLATANYDEEIVEYLLDVSSELDRDRTLRLIVNEPVKVLMILNAPRDEWARDLKNKYGATTSIFEVFYYGKAEENLKLPYDAFEVNGDYPVYSISTTTYCSVHSLLPLLKIEDNSVLGFEPGTKIVLEYKNCVTFWNVSQGPEETIWIMTAGRNVIVQPNKRYKITKLRDNSLLLDVM